MLLFTLYDNFIFLSNFLSSTKKKRERTVQQLTNCSVSIPKSRDTKDIHKTEIKKLDILIMVTNDLWLCFCGQCWGSTIKTAPFPYLMKTKVLYTFITDKNVSWKKI